LNLFPAGRVQLKLRGGGHMLYFGAAGSGG
jgi:hypothetical protein